MTDVTAQVVIHRPRDVVAAFASDPNNAARWCEGIEFFRQRSEGCLAVGFWIVVVARVLGRRLEYTAEFIEFDPGRRLVMRATGDALVIETTYEWSEEGEESTRMTLRTRGEIAGPARTSGTGLDRAVWRANRKSLERLRRLLEAPGVA